MESILVIVASVLCSLLWGLVSVYIVATQFGFYLVEIGQHKTLFMNEYAAKKHAGKSGVITPLKVRIL